MKTFPMAELARGLHASSSLYKAIAVLHARLDEGGTHAQSPIVTIGGLVARADLWAALEPEWQEKLDNLHVPYFHASPCDAGEKPYQHLSRPLRESLFAGLATVIAKHKPIVICVAVKRAEWDAAKARGETPFDDPYHQVFEFAMQQLARWSMVEMDREPIALMFAKHPQYQQQGQRIFELYSRSSWGDVFASLSFSNPEKFIPLQAADLVLYEKTRREIAKQTDPEIPMRPALKIISDADVMQIDLPQDSQVTIEVISAWKRSSAGQSS